MFSRQAHPGNGTAARHSALRIDLTATAGPDAARHERDAGRDVGHASRAALGAARVCSGHLFGPVFDPAEHLLAHYEADRLDGLDEEPGPRPGVGVSFTHE